MCERRGGFVADDSPRLPEQIQGFEILEDSVRDIFGHFFVFPDGMPERKIIHNESAVYHGMAACHKLKKPIRNDRGNLLVRSRISSIFLKASIFRYGGYHDALSTYVHEACHMFGGDSSQAFSLGLTLAMEILLDHGELLTRYAEQWNALFTATADGSVGISAS